MQALNRVLVNFNCTNSSNNHHYHLNTALYFLHSSAQRELDVCDPSITPVTSAPCLADNPSGVFLLLGLAVRDPSGNSVTSLLHILNPITECCKGQQILILLVWYMVVLGSLFLIKRPQWERSTAFCQKSSR